jgi:hypothetical protein
VINVDGAQTRAGQGWADRRQEPDKDKIVEGTLTAVSTLLHLRGQSDEEDGSQGHGKGNRAQLKGVAVRTGQSPPAYMRLKIWSGLRLYHLSGIRIRPEAFQRGISEQASHLSPLSDYKIESTSFPSGKSKYNRAHSTR